jgi:hypothetical protein
VYGFVDVNYLVRKSRNSPRWARPAPEAEARAQPRPEMPITINIPAPTRCDREQQRVLAELFSMAR